jgi:hypothetical protein
MVSNTTTTPVEYPQIMTLPTGNFKTDIEPVEIELAIPYQAYESYQAKTKLHIYESTIANIRNIFYNMPDCLQNDTAPTYETSPCDANMFMPIQLSRIEVDGYQLIADPPLSLALQPDCTIPYLVSAREESLGIDVVGSSRDELLSMLKEQLVFLWETFALEDDDRLTFRAQHLKKNLLDRIRSVSDGIR